MEVFLVSANSNSFSSLGGLWVFKTNSSGSLLWNYSNKDWGGAFAARQAVDGSVIIAGPGLSGDTGDLYVVKIK